MTEELKKLIKEIPRYYVQREFGWTGTYDKDEDGSEMNTTEVEAAIIKVWNLAIETAAQETSIRKDLGHGEEKSHWVNKDAILSLKIKE